MRAGRRAGRAAYHERAEPGAGLDEALAFQVAVGLEDGVGVDRRCRDDFAHRGELVADVEHAHPECLANLLNDLQVRGTTERPSSRKLITRARSSSKYYGAKTLD